VSRALTRRSTIARNDCWKLSKLSRFTYYTTEPE
jgi:hypothetical protein